MLYVLFVLVFGLAVYRYAAAYWAKPRRARKLEAGQAIDYVVDLNTADRTELDLLPGIGPARAASIIEYRKVRGPFRQADDLARVPGVSRACVEGLRGLVAPAFAGPPGEGLK